MRPVVAARAVWTGAVVGCDVSAIALGVAAHAARCFGKGWQDAKGGKEKGEDRAHDYSRHPSTVPFKLKVTDEPPISG